MHLLPKKGSKIFLPIKKQKPLISKQLLSYIVFIILYRLPNCNATKSQTFAEQLRCLFNHSSESGVSIDYIVNGSIKNKAETAINDHFLLRQFKAVEQMDQEDKNIVSKLIDAFITKKRIKDISAY